MKKLALFGFLGLIALFVISFSPSKSLAEESFTPIVGDADCSGSVNAVDAVLVMRNAVGLPALGSDQARATDCLSLADTNCDASVDTFDALVILRFVVGKKPLAGAGDCILGQGVPDLEEGKNVIAKDPLLDKEGRQIGTLVVITESSRENSAFSASAALADYYWSCMSEVYAKNVWGMKVFSLKHYQGYRYNGFWLTQMYAPFRTTSTAPGWSVSDGSTIGPNNYGWIGESHSQATFKYLNAPWLGAFQSYTVVAGVYVYGNGHCNAWGSW